MWWLPSFITKSKREINTSVYSCAFTQPQLSQPCEHHGYAVVVAAAAAAAAAARGELEMNRMKMLPEVQLQFVFASIHLEISTAHSLTLVQCI